MIHSIFKLHIILASQASNLTSWNLTFVCTVFSLSSPRVEAVEEVVVIHLSCLCQIRRCRYVYQYLEWITSHVTKLLGRASRESWSTKPPPKQYHSDSTLNTTKHPRTHTHIYRYTHTQTHKHIRALVSARSPR